MLISKEKQVMAKNYPQDIVECNVDKDNSNGSDAYSDITINISRSWVPDFKKMAYDLKTIASETENEFLALGMKLQNFSVACIENAELATGVATQIESGDGFSISSFKSLFEDIYNVIETTTETMSEGLEMVADLRLNLNEIIVMEEYFKKLARSITIIGTLIRIETAHAKQAEFNVMTGVVDDLAKQILSSSREIFNTVQASIGKVMHVHGMIEPYIETFDRELSKVKERVKMILNELDGMAMQAKWLCERIGGRAAKITPEIGEVVTAIQFHDITRQQMEHVGEALDDSVEKLIDLSQLDNASKITSIRWIYEVLKIQLAQIILIVKETNNAADLIAQHLSLVYDLSEAQAEDATMIIAEEESGSDKIKMIGIALDGLSKILNAIKTMGIEMAKSIYDITEKIGGMTEQVKKIEMISDSINLLSLNAIIKASKTGADGRTLVVLAEEISKLSSHASEKIGEGFKALKGILAKSENFKYVLQDKLQQQLTFSEHISRQAKSSMENLLEDSKKIMDSMNRISAKTKILKDDITKVIKGINFNKLIEERLTNFHETLENIFNELGESVPAYCMESEELAPDLTEMLKRYTMQSERRIHQTTSDKERSHAGTGDVELFGSDDDQSSTDSSMGDNVELF